MKRRDRLAAHAAQRRAAARASARAEGRALFADLRARLAVEGLGPTLRAEPAGDGHAGTARHDDCPLCRLGLPTETLTLPDGRTVSISMAR